MGVVSKNDMGDRSTLYSISLWSLAATLNIRVSARMKETRIEIP